MKTRERASETPTTGLSVASSVRMVLARLIALFDLRRLSIPRNGKFVLSGLNRSKPEIIFPGKSAWFYPLFCEMFYPLFCEMWVYIIYLIISVIIG